MRDARSVIPDLVGDLLEILVVRKALLITED